MIDTTRLSIALIAAIAASALSLTGCGQKQTEPSATAEPESPRKILLELDADANGLYDDRERMAMLDVLLEECPELQDTLNASVAPVAKAASNYQEDFEDGPATTTPTPAAETPVSFDADGDGRVTVEEQTEGRHPLSLLVPRRIVDADRKIPWALDIFPEWLSSAYFQEDVAPGTVTEHEPRGTLIKTAAQAADGRQPSKADARGGVEFAANSGQHFSMPGDREARWNYRWCLFTFRIDGNSGTDEQTVLLDLNKGNKSNQSSPKIWCHKKSGLHVQYLGLKEGDLDKRIVSSPHVKVDGETWNVVVCGIRYGRLVAFLNGVPMTSDEPQPDRFSGEWPPQEMTSFIGDKSDGNMAWAYDALVFGLTEPSEAMIRKMTGWAAHRLGFQENLSQEHPYRDQRPVLDAEDFPYRYVHDDEKWNAWGQSLKNKEVTRANAGGPRVEPQGFERVFYDDFRANRVAPSSSAEGELWMGHGFNIAVGADAPLVTPGKKPEVYLYDAEKQQLTLSLAHDGKRWRGSAIYTVNDLGHGYTWIGPKVIRIRCMFPQVDKKDLAGGLFPAFWSYDPANLVWRTQNRIEVDWFEFDGQNPRWLNGLSTHFHYPYLRKTNIFAKNTSSYKRYKAYSGELTEAKSRIPGGIYIWDGQFHTWEFVVDEEMTHVNVTIPDENGEDRWVEIYRCPTSPVYLERLDLQLDYALKANHGTPEPGDRQDFVVDWIEVLQKSSALETVPEPFTARPGLSGSNTADSTVTCEPNLESITDIRYYWFADGYPLTWGANDTYTLTEADAGKTIRCMVKAVGARDMPEAWSDILQ